MKILSRYIIAVLIVLVPCLSSAQPALLDPPLAEGSPERIRLGVAPFNINAEPGLHYLRGAVYDMLTSRLGSRQGVEVVGALKMLKGYPESAVMEDIAPEVGKKLEADYLLYGSISVIGKEVSLDVRIFDVKNAAFLKPLYLKGKGIDAIAGMTEELAEMALYSIKGITMPDAGKPSMLEKEGEIKFEKPGAEKIFLWKDVIEGEFVKDIEVYDMDGDGKNEIFLLTDKDVIAGKIGNNGIEEKRIIESKGDVKNISISAYDMDRDGRGEIYVSRLSSNKADTCRVEFDGKDYIFSKCGIPYFVRTVKTGGSETLLLGQAFRWDGGFYKKAVILKKDGDAIKADKEFDPTHSSSGFPDGVNLYDFEMFDMDGDGVSEVVAGDDNGYITVYKQKSDGWTKEWKSVESYGPTLNTIDMEKGFAGINNRFSYYDFDGDGLGELMVKRNVAGGIFGEMSERARTFKSGRVEGLKWDGAVFSSKWKSDEFSGYAADFIIGDISGGGSNEIFIVVYEGGGIFSKDTKSSILLYRLNL